jgi:hypothetical protein
MRRRNEGDCDYKVLQNTVVEKFVKIQYPHHPHFGKTLEVLEVHRKSNPPGYECKVSGHVTLFIPKWMTCPEFEGYPVKQSPQIRLESLLELVDYLTSIENAASP